ncbi:unnamed protein product [Thlaspi arvense]|uniref:F-box domain-containing protein n=1 Tax=Thlaspi arvense TaxID=13288 RepID=A0AAU9SEV5_THLAR|nr:unnamed protein product [Thlaspi arvense]
MASTTDFTKSLLSPFSHGNASLNSQRGCRLTWPNQHKPRICRRSLRVNGLFGGGKKDNTEDGQSKFSNFSSMTSSKRRSLSLPFELVEEILYKVPVESLVRFKTVCKQWYALFNDKRFIYKHLDLSQERFVRLDVDDQSIQVFNPETNARLPLPFPDELHIQKLSKTIHCDGFLLSVCTERGSPLKIKGLAVWNPILSGVTWIKPSNSCKLFDIYGFGYDNVSRVNYKILRIYTSKVPEIEIYEFKSKLWRSVDATTLKCDALWDSLSMNGNMYWLAQKKMDNSEIEFFIQSFDFSTETFKPISCVPEGTKCHRGYQRGVLLSGLGGDRLTLFHQVRHLKMEVWVTSKLTDGVISWTKYFNISPDPSISQSTFLGRISPKYFIHKTNKIMLLCEESDRKEKNFYTNVYKIREGRIEKQVEMTVSYRLCDYRCNNVYVPSLVPVPCLKELGSRKPKKEV